MRAGPAPHAPHWRADSAPRLPVNDTNSNSGFSISCGRFSKGQGKNLYETSPLADTSDVPIRAASPPALCRDRGVLAKWGTNHNRQVVSSSFRGERVY